MKTIRFQWISLAAAAAFIVVCQCAFFNVFYNAKASYDTAYRDHRKLLKNNPDSVLTSLPSEIQTNYDRALEKAAKVLDEFPKDKKWHDDAFFIMGKANYYKGDYEKSVRNFARLQENFPSSPFIPESFMYMARAYIRMGSLDRAEQMLTLIAEKYPQLNNDQEVSLLMAEVALNREGKALALELLEKTTAKVKSRERKIDLIIRTAGLAMSLNQYDKAIRLLNNCPRDKKYPTKLYLLDMTLVACYEAMDSLTEAMRLTDRMLNYKLYGAYVPYILLKKASIFTSMNNIDKAIATYTSITDVYAPAPAVPSTPAAPAGSNEGKFGTEGKAPPVTSPEQSRKYPDASTPAPVATGIAAAAGQAAAGTALFELGMLYQIKKGDFVKAKDYFSRAITASQDSTIRAHATLRVKSIDSLFAYRTIKDTADTSKGMGRRNAFDFKIGELFWLEMDLPDSAIAHFKRLATCGDSLRPKALYSASYISRSGLKDTAASDSLYGVLLKEFPSNVYTQKAQVDRGEKVTVHTRADSAQDAYMSAESLFCYVNNPEGAATAFKNVYSLYPDCETGIKALYAAAWINDDALKNNKTAYKLYRTLCDSFPKCELCTAAVKPRLKTVSDTLAARKARGIKGKVAIPATTVAAAKPKTVAAVPSTPASPAPSSATGQTDSLSDMKDQDPKRLDSLRRAAPPFENPHDMNKRRMPMPQIAPTPPPQPATAPPPQPVKGSISEDTTASAPAAPKVEKQPVREVAPVATPAATPAPNATRAPVAPPPQPIAPKAPESPKPEIKAENTDSVEVIGQPGK